MGHSNVKSIEIPIKFSLEKKVTTTLTPTETSIPSSPGLTGVQSAPTSSPQNTNSSSWQYPSSKATSSNTFETTDDAQIVTNWYKNKIQSMGMHTTSFVQVNTNDNVNNKLAGSDNRQEVDISITKSSGDSTVHISIAYTSPTI